MVKIEIDGETLHVQPGAMIIEAADKAGIAIPRFCYHKKLSIAANCRMCLVDVENVGKPLPACATPVSEGMKVHTCSEKAKAAQTAVMEFLLINHPLDCPVCDQGGQCELQDVALAYGQSESQFTERKRAVADQDLGPLIATEMTRCIHCTRCVRFGKEIAGVQELGATGRGEHMQIGTYISASVTSELSGNVIDLCPVGALTSKPFRHSARAWEVMSQPGIGMHDGLGSNTYYHIHRGQVARAVPRENERLNEVWLSDRDRFSYQGLYTDRLSKPEMKVNGTWQTVSWQAALAAVEETLTPILQQDPSQVGVLTNSSASLEEYFLLQQLSRSLGIQNIDHRVHQVDFNSVSKLSDNPGFNCDLPTLQAQDAILVIGSLLNQESPLVTHRLRQATLAGAQLAIMNPMDVETTLSPHASLLQLDMVNGLSQIAAALQIDAPELAKIVVSESAAAIAAMLEAAGTSALILGQWVETHPQRSQLYMLAEMIAEKVGATCNTMTFGTNSRGAWEAGVRPEAEGLNAAAMLAQPRKAYLLHNLELEAEAAAPGQAMAALAEAEAVVMVTPYVTETMRRYATVLLPSVPMTETSGTYINHMGDWQTVRAVTSPQGEARPAWKIFRVLGNTFKQPNFEYQTVAEVLQAARLAHVNRQHRPVESPTSQKMVTPAAKSFIRLAPYPLYRQDAIVRRATALQTTAQQQALNVLQMNPEDLAQLGIAPGSQVIVEQAGIQSDPVVVQTNAGLLTGTVLLAQGIAASTTLGSGFTTVRITAHVA